MFHTLVEVCSPIGAYPDLTVLTSDTGQANCIGLPLCLTVEKTGAAGMPVGGRLTEVLWASFLVTMKDFPAFAFSKQEGPAFVVYKSDKRPKLAAVLSDVEQILRGNRKVPITYLDELYGIEDYEELEQRKREIESHNVRIHINNSNRMTLSSHVEQWKWNSKILECRCRESTVRKYYSWFKNSSRFIRIALHYFVHAASLTDLRYIEEAGLNLELTVDAIVHDYMTTSSIRKKARAIERLKEVVLLPYSHMDFLGKLYEARNSYLAHIDEDMFTESQNTNNPDAYCYEHYESVCWLITRYVKFKREAHLR